MPSRPPRSSTSAAGFAAFVAWLAASARAAHAGTPTETPRAIAARVLADPRYQTRMPDGTTSHAWAGLHVVGGGLADLLTDVGIAAVVVLALAWIGIVVQRRMTRAKGAVPDERAETPAREAASASLFGAQRLADAGDFTGAVHALLLLTLEHLGARPDAPAPPSHTSREIVRGLANAVAPERGAALAELVRHVEVSIFGGRTLERGDYERCVGFCRAALGEGA